MPLGPITIDTGDAIPGTFTYTAVLGTPPYTYEITFGGLSGTGIVGNIGGLESNVVTFDATNALGGNYVIDIRGKVTDDVGDTNQSQADDLEQYFINVNPPTTIWSGNLLAGTLDNTDTSTAQVTYSGTLGGQAPYTLSAEWVQRPDLTVDYLVTGNTTIQITTAGTIGGNYTGELRAVLTDNLGQRMEQLFTVTLDVALPEWDWVPASLLTETDEGVEATSAISVATVVSGVVAPPSYVSHRFSGPPSPFGALVLNVITPTNVTYTIPDTLPGNITINDNILVDAFDALGQMQTVSLPITAVIDGALPPTPPTWDEVIAGLAVVHQWLLDEASLSMIDVGANASADINQAINTGYSAFQQTGVVPGRTANDAITVGPFNNQNRSARATAGGVST